MAVLLGNPAGRTPEIVHLSISQTGDGASTNIVDRGDAHKGGIVRIITVVGSTPTCTYALEVSTDGETFTAATYADIDTPDTDTTDTFALTTATIAQKIIKDNGAWRYFRVTYSANTNVTNTVDFLYDDGKTPPWS